MISTAGTSRSFILASGEATFFSFSFLFQNILLPSEQSKMGPFFLMESRKGEGRCQPSTIDSILLRPTPRFSLGQATIATLQP